VASLLQVTPVADPGQPQQLALAQGPEVQVALAPSAPAEVAEPAPAASFSADPAPVFEVSEARPSAVATAEPAPVVEAVASEMPAKPVPLIRAATSPIRQVVVPASDSAAGRSARPFHPVESGAFVVQIGAFSSASRGEVAWRGAVGRYRELNDYTAATARVQVKNATLYRLSVSGFTTRAAAGQVCARIKAAGGDCFVRSVAGDTPLQWASAKSGTRLASRN